MNNGSTSKREVSGNPSRSRTLAVWSGATALGGLAGAQIAHLLFPSAAFGSSYTSGWSHAGFASSVGIPLAISQWLALRHFLRHREATHSVFLHLWIPATAIGIALMILPLWGAAVDDFVFNAWLVAAAMVPGMLFLGVTQWLLLRRLTSGRYLWALLTIMGAWIGSIFGLRLGFAVTSFMPRTPLELSWAFAAGAVIGALQAIELVSSLEVDRGRHGQAIKLQVTILALGLGFLILYNIHAIRVAKAIFG